ncbi:predicted protein [Sclerotinia sclerotiorum 1980 UF-70]|uniref:Uncharacterized protein n=1 Tax=Sclerotinia sclerotiorum (strain ATCC 18683 / 1980 / Ss-1) TaxID=665079 RepID=A7E7Z2_SCLS1|nr:predicted protein [Sclerotinia sclerotiorum 1980 UF-70]EDN96494.1 predicted protein [Sclerotinia sclerotiorum 1980 UF-70]
MAGLKNLILDDLCLASSMAKADVGILKFTRDSRRKMPTGFWDTTMPIPNPDLTCSRIWSGL